MKKTSLFFFCCVMSLALSAQRINLEDARAYAESFYGTTATRAVPAELELAYTAESQIQAGEADFYVFNHQGGGFVLVAADERVSDILIGHSDNGTFNYEEIPSNMKWWLQEYVRQIDYLRANVKPTKQHAKALKATSNEEIIIAPLLGDTQWDQDTPFNNYTPESAGGKAQTGCVATAMAQIMYYHKWPKVGMGSHADTHCPDLMVDFSQSVYRWDQMLDTYKEAYTAEQADAVAKLMLDCGVSVDMNYSSEGSGAYSTSVPEALKTYFDYSDDATYLSRDYYTGDWDSLLISELENFRPIYYSGTDSVAGGHAFVCDGYEVMDNEILMHINWGWGGTDDGYYKSAVLETEDYSFASEQEIVYQIYPNHKIKSGSLYYKTRLGNRLQVACPKTIDEYSGDIVIPPSLTLDGQTYTVTDISPSAFSGCDKVSSVDIPSSVIHLGDQAFYGCTGLKTLLLHWDDPLVLPAHTFEKELWSQTSLVVPDGCVGKYADAIPWMFFSVITDRSGHKVERSPWAAFETGKGVYQYSDAFFGASKGEYEVFESHRLGEENNCLLIIKTWGRGTDLVLTYDKETNQCTIPKQTIGKYMYFNSGPGEKGVINGDVYLGDMVEWAKDMEEDLKTYNHDSYPCTYDPVTGIFSFHVAYFVPNATFGKGIETFTMQGEQYKDMVLSITSKNDLVEASDHSASQKLTVDVGKDVAKYRYAVLEGWMDDKERKETALKIADGTIESKLKVVTFMNLLSVTYPRSGKYTVIAVSVDAEGNSYGHFGYWEVEFLSDNWKEVAKGTYSYSLAFCNDDDTPYLDIDLDLSRHMEIPNIWKISHVFYDVDFIFTWDEETDLVTFDAQNTGTDYSIYGPIYVADNTSYFEPDSKYYSEPSFFDRETETFHFSNVYHVEDGFFSEWIGTETFSVEGLSNAIKNVIQKKQETDTATFNLSGQKVSGSYKGLIIHNGKKYMKK